MTKREKYMLYVIPVLFVVLICKSLFLDEVKVSGDALQFKNFVETIVENDKRYNGPFKEIGIAHYKVVSIKKIKDTGTSVISNGKENIKIAGAYEGKVRGYLLYIFPYKEFRIKSNWKK
ncbi:hypothetical protein [Inediibacterium massiliense]|uniref:hypothetical protein n=1 Tax=Inediibacterium massiliense TaxID=1658111 RepID=UPI0006B4CF6C|nr:hypothetical protein [Inediibacterium massiliense]